MGPRPWRRGEDRCRRKETQGTGASMGPRPWRRGEATGAVTVVAEVTLQWGRAPGGAERILRGHRRPFLLRGASMGPRPWRRGETSRCGSRCAGAGRFNGAAPLEARREPQTSSSRVTMYSFNGAAPLEARRGGCRRACVGGHSVVAKRAVVFPGAITEWVGMGPVYIPYLVSKDLERCPVFFDHSTARRLRRFGSWMSG